MVRCAFLKGAIKMMVGSYFLRLSLYLIRSKGISTAKIKMAEKHNDARRSAAGFELQRAWRIESIP
jgi:hypothetical protein